MMYGLNDGGDEQRSVSDRSSDRLLHLLHRLPDCCAWRTLLDNAVNCNFDCHRCEVELAHRYRRAGDKGLLLRVVSHRRQQVEA